MENLKFTFFGTSRFSQIVLEELKKAGLTPAVIVTTPDRESGRGLKLTSSPVKLWAEKNNIELLQPEILDESLVEKLRKDGGDIHIVASYGKITPANIFNLPKYGTLNIHPSLLPKLRGASPIEATILNEDKAGVTIMKVDEKMDHGPILAQKEISIHSEWPPYFLELEEILAKEGAALLIETIPKYISGEITPVEQNHDAATFTKKVKKEDAQVDLADDPMTNLRKIRAYEEWPRAYTFFDIGERKIRVIITKARIENGVLKIEKVIPEGKKEMTWEDFERGFLKN